MRKLILTRRGRCATGELLLVAKADACLSAQHRCSRRGQPRSVEKSHFFYGVAVLLGTHPPTAGTARASTCCGYASGALAGAGQWPGAGCIMVVVRLGGPARGGSARWWPARVGPRMAVPGNGRRSFSQFIPTLRSG